jgi:hypothetical protein
MGGCVAIVRFLDLGDLDWPLSRLHLLVNSFHPLGNKAVLASFSADRLGGTEPSSKNGIGQITVQYGTER